MSHSERKHAKMSASGSARWLACPGSVKAEQGYENRSNFAADEGTCAHEVCEKALLTGNPTTFYIDEVFNGITVDVDMAIYADKYVEYVQDLYSQSRNPMLMIEQRVDFSNVVPEGFGTLDACVILPELRECHIIDFKYGRQLVDAYENSQGKLYALGIMNEMGHLDLFDTVHIHIVQPRIENFSHWETSVDELEEWKSEVKKSVNLALSKNPPRNASEKACQWCKAKSNCPTLAEQIGDELMSDFDDLTTLTDEQKVEYLSRSKLIISFLESVEQEMLDRLMDGEQVEGLKLIEGRSTTKWLDGAIEQLEQQYGDKLYQRKPIGITEARKLLSKDELSEHTVRVDGNPKVVTANSKGKPYTNF